MKAIKIGIVLLLVLVTAGSIVAPTIAEDIKTKKITQTPTGIEINDIKPIDFYPGILIGTPKDYTVEKVDILYKKVNKDTAITLASITIKSNGKLIDGYVLAAWSRDVSFGTIILPEEEGWKVETDIAIFANSAKRILVSQDLKPTLSQHYSSLIDVVSVLEKENNAKYEELKELIKYVSDVVQADLKEFDKVIEDSKATVTVYSINPYIAKSLSYYRVDSKTLDAVANGDYGGASIRGTYESWRDPPNDFITFSDEFTFSVSGYVEMEMHRDYTIINDISGPYKTWGIGTILYSTGGEGHNFVGYGGVGSVGYYVSFDTSWFDPEDSYVVVDVEASGGGALEVDSDRLMLY